MPDHPTDSDPNRGPDPATAPEPDLVAQFLDEALQAHEDGRQPPLAAWSQRHPELALEFERAARVASEIGLVRARVGPALPGFQIDAEIGRGGMGVVYRARQASLNNRSVAIKVLGPSAAITPQALARFRAEARAVASLRHPNVVTVYDVVEREGELAYVMEFVDGGSLELLLRFLAAHSGTKPPSPPRRLDEVRAFLQDNIGVVQEPNYVVFICRTAIALARALDAVHRDGLLHRDIKPANVLLRRDGTPLLTDFGLAVDSGGESLPGVTAAGTPSSRVGPEFSGTLGYAAPEQLRGRALGRRSDIFALGATIYHALALRPAFPGSTTRDVLAQMEAGPPNLSQCNPDVPADLAAIIQKSMATDPFERYAAAGELASDLERLLRLEPVSARAHSPGYVLRKLLQRNRVTAALAVAALLLLILGIVGTSLGMLKARAEAARSEQLALESASNEYFATIQAAAAALALSDGVSARERLERIEPARRGWEWRYLSTQSNQSAGRIEVPGALPGEVPLIAYSDDGRTLFAACREFVTAFDSGSWAIRWTTPTRWSEGQRPVALLPGWNDDVWVVHSAGGILRASERGLVGVTVPSGNTRVTSAEWSPARDRIVLLEQIDGSPQVRVVDYACVAPDRTATVPLGKASLLSIEPAVGIVLCSGPAGTVALRWPSLEALNLPDHAEQTAVAANAPGGIFASSGPRGLLVSDSDGGRPAAATTGLSNPQALAWVPGQPIVIGGCQRVLAVWEPFSGEVKQRLLGHEADIVSITASPDARSVVSVDAFGDVLRWSIEAVVRPVDRKWAAASRRAPSAEPQSVISALVSEHGVEARVASGDPFVVEMRTPGSDWCRARFNGPITAILLQEPCPTVFVAVRGGGVHVMREASRSGTRELTAILTLQTPVASVHRLTFEGDTLVASGTSGESRWRTTNDGPRASPTLVHELLSANNGYGDAFGYALASDTRRLIVGSPYSDVFEVSDVGAAVVFRRDLQSGWTQEARLVPSAAALNSNSGFSVAIDGDWAAVGWPGHIFSDAGDTGGVTLFRWQRGRWCEVQTLRARSPERGHHFGWSVSLHGGLLAVGATGMLNERVSRNPVSLFALKDEIWSLVSEIEQPTSIQNSRFGNWVDLWGRTLIISERLTPQDGLANVGRVHVYTVSDSSVTLTDTILPASPQQGMEFGYSVSIRDDRFAVSSPSATDSAGNSGRVDVYRQRDDGRWTLERTFPPSAGAPTHRMGTQVEIAEGLVLAASHDHEKFVLLPLDESGSPRSIFARIALTPGAHFGGHFTWLGDGFATAADLDSRYEPSAGSVWIFPDPRDERQRSLEPSD